MDSADEISLRQYIDIRVEAVEKAVLAAIAASDRAVNKAEAANEKRFDAVNEFRGALNDSTRLMMPRSEAEQSFRVLSEKIEVFGKRVDAREQQGRGLNQGWIILASVISVLSSIGMFIYTITKAH
jgi:hypothetical protein